MTGQPPPADPDRTVAVATQQPQGGLGAAAGAADPDATRLRTQVGAQPSDGSNNVLPPGTRLHEFELLGVIGEGGFGIVYKARDGQLERTVAVKEYMPSALAGRRADASVVVKSPEHRETFDIGLRSFINEAKMLAQFDHPALVKVYRFFEANGTAYMAMPLYEGGNLKQALKARANWPALPPDEAWLRRLLVPLLDAVDLLHRSDCLHRDIAPDNVLLVGGDRPDVRPLLLDFGAARRVLGGINGNVTQALTVILKPGFAPIEQYDEIPGMKQGPWTDLYALGALMHFAITGKAPPPSVGRMVHDAYRPLAQVAQGRYSDRFLAAIDAALAPAPQARPQSIGAFRKLLASSDAAARPLLAPSPVQATPAPSVPAARPRAPLRLGRALAAGTALAALIVGGAWGVLAWRDTTGARVALETKALTEANAARSAQPQAQSAPQKAAQETAPIAASTTAPTTTPFTTPPATTAAPSISTNTAAPNTAATNTAATNTAAPAASAQPKPLPIAATKPAPPKPIASASPVAPAPTKALPAAPPAWIDAALAEGRDCYAARNYTCTIARAESVLKAEPAHEAATALLRQARSAQEAALASDWKMR
jgi:serine/threonine protein kinase